MWVNDRGIARWFGIFPEPDDEELRQYGYTPPSRHGSTYGYRQHYQRGEKPCRSCRDAYSRWRRQRRQVAGRSDRMSA